MKESTNITNAAKIAEFRFALIAPVIQGLFPDASRTAYYKRVTERPLEFPDGTVREVSYATVGVSSGSTSAKSLVKAMIEQGLISGDNFDEESFDPATWTEGVKFQQYDDYPTISTALSAGEVDSFCVDKSILAIYKTEGRSYIDAEFAPQNYGIATTKGSGMSAVAEQLVSESFADGTIDKLIAENGLE